MTTFTTITAGETDVDSPITQPLMEALRDNPLAMFEGTAGAPGLQLEALEDLSAGAVELFNDTTLYTSTSTTYAAIFQFVPLQSGGMRISFRHGVSTSNGVDSDARIRVNKSTISSWANSSTTKSTRTEDITFTRGQLIEIEHKVSNASPANTSEVVDIKMLTNGELIFPTLISEFWTL